MVVRPNDLFSRAYSSFPTRMKVRSSSCTTVASTFSRGNPRNLKSWSTRDDVEAKRFAGTARYTITFDRPAGTADDWQLDLGRVCESARVKLNGHELGTLFAPPFRVAVGQALRPGANTLEVEADINESSIGKITPGLQAEVTLDALPGEKLAAEVRKIIPTADRQKATVKVKVRFKESLKGINQKVVVVRQNNSRTFHDS